jgi:hypothetical protein
LSLGEFVVAMHLTSLARAGQPMPAELPSHLIPHEPHSDAEAEADNQVAVDSLVAPTAPVPTPPPSPPPHDQPEPAEVP